MTQVFKTFKAKQVRSRPTYKIRKMLWIVCCTVMLASCAQPEPKPEPVTFKTVQAKSAYDFTDSVGVNIHLHYVDTVYTEFSDIIEPALLELGVKHVRDGVYTYAAAERDTFYYERMRSLIAAGIRPTLITSIGDGEFNEPTNYERLAATYAWLDGEIEAFEGVNEPDLSGIENWVALTREAQQTLFETVKADAAMKDTPVLGPSVSQRNKELGDVSDYLDFGNIHPYADGQAPSRQGYGIDTASSIKRAGLVSGDKPIIATESGYHNAVNSQEQHKGVSERASAIYMPRLLLGHFGLGIERTFLYELIDLRPDRDFVRRDLHFGLLRNDGSQKPAFASVKNLLSILADEADFSAGELEYRLSGPEDLNSLLLQKQDGTFYLALWRGVSSYDTQKNEDIMVSAQKVTLELRNPASLSAYAFATDGRVSQSVLAGNAVELELKDTVTILEIKE